MSILNLFMEVFRLIEIDSLYGEISKADIAYLEKTNPTTLEVKYHYKKRNGLLKQIEILRREAYFN